MKMISVYALALGLIAAAPTLSYARGGDGSGGGDSTEQEFVRFGNAGVDALDRKAPQFPQIIVHNVRALWDSPAVKVVSTDETLLDENGREREALNYPSEQLIKVNKKSWNAISDRKRKMALALHEILGLARYESGNYVISAAVFNLNPAELEYGSRMGAVTNNSSYCPVGSGWSNWVHVLVDLPSSSAVLTFWNGISVSLYCDARGWCNGAREVGKSQKESYVERYDVQFFPDASFRIEMVSPDPRAQIQEGNPIETKPQDSYFTNARTYLPYVAR